MGWKREQADCDPEGAPKMGIADSNQVQADFWAAAGTMWIADRHRFDRQVDHHGQAAIDALAPAAGERVIDIGCGVGSTTLAIAEAVGPTGHVRGLDISPTMIEGAAAFAEAEGVTNVSFAVGDAMVEPFESDADALFSRFGVMFFSDATAGFANMLHAIRPGGRLGFTCWQSPADNPWASVPLTIASEFVDIPFGGDPTAPGPFSLGDVDRLRSVVEDAGFAEVEITPRTADAMVGTDLEDAIDFLFRLIPPVAALEADDPAGAAELRARLATELAPWETPDGVQVPSAVWIVTAKRET
ncbi:MAG: class I SAM-dependent methyltransferase [Actinomycetota bacterium]